MNAFPNAASSCSIISLRSSWQYTINRGSNHSPRDRYDIVSRSDKASHEMIERSALPLYLFLINNFP
jgi:hypothetical protein